MKPLAKQRCVHVERRIDKTAMHKEEVYFDMELYEHEIIANSERFPLADVFDISFYPIQKTGDEYRFLYLHTSSGIRTFHVKELPEEFIRTCKKLIDGELDWKKNR